MQRTSFRLALGLVVLSIIACGDDDGSDETTTHRSTQGATDQPTPRDPDPATQPDPGAVPDELPHGLLISYAQFETTNGRATARPAPSRVELLSRRGGEWHVESFEDETSTVIHKAVAYTPPGGERRILTIGGMGAAVKLWRRQDGEWRGQTLWSEQFGPTNSRMRDVEIADLYGDGMPTMAVGTHDQGVFAVLRSQTDGSFNVTRLDQSEQRTVIHEIEIGDLNQDGTLEVYLTRSAPNTLSGEEQPGEVVRYVPRNDEGRTVVAALGNRHAKEIYVGDVDGDGRDELYVAVEALTGGESGSEVIEPVEIRRYDHDTAPDAGITIATINDRFNRFLTVGDVDGDGKKEMVAASFTSGLWLLRPGSNPRSEWSIESIDRDSGGWEHAALLADLDEDGRDELYVDATSQGEFRRYVWINHRPRRETIQRRPVTGSLMAFNITTYRVADYR